MFHSKKANAKRSVASTKRFHKVLDVIKRIESGLKQKVQLNA